MLWVFPVPNFFLVKFCEIVFGTNVFSQQKNCHFCNITNLKTKTLGTSEITRQERMKDVLKWNICFVSIY
jgi:hypothetical protein